MYGDIRERRLIDGDGAAADQLEFGRAEFAHRVEFTRIGIHSKTSLSWSVMSDAAIEAPNSDRDCVATPREARCL